MTCTRCDGDRHVETEPDSGLWKPCPACNTDAHHQWAAGRYQPPPRVTQTADQPTETIDPNHIRTWFTAMRRWLAEPQNRPEV